MDRANKPTELDVGHDELDAFVRLFSAGPVVEGQQDSGRHLDPEQKERHPAEIIPDGMTMDRDDLLPDEMSERPEIDSLFEPGRDSNPPHLTYPFISSR